MQEAGSSKQSNMTKWPFPRAIRATDAEGRSRIYLAEGPDGQPIDIKALDFDTEIRDRSRPASIHERLERSDSAN
jgi:hypothetical protein